jgi:hypothetical protein
MTPAPHRRYVEIPGVKAVLPRRQMDRVARAMALDDEAVVPARRR